MVVRGDILYTSGREGFTVLEDGYLELKEGRVASVSASYTGEEEVLDRRGRLIIPSFVDMHLHANQYANCGLGSDVELLEWLEKYTYPEEVKFKDPAYAEAIYKQVLNSLWECGSLRSVMFASLYKEASALLFRLTLKSGLSAYIGKVNMDRNTPPYYIEETEESIRGSEELIREFEDPDSLVRPIVTPRFVPHCTSASMEGQGRLAEEYRVPVQSHINESDKEISWVRKLHPEAESYSAVYESFGLFGGARPAVMAHCIHNTDAELELMKKRGVYPVHCPESNANLASGIMPVKRLLHEGLPVCLGSDISGGHHLYLPAQIVLAIQLSKMKSRLEGDMSQVLTLSEAFYMATKSGGSFFGKTGSFEEGYQGDFLVVETDSLMAYGEKRSALERLEKFIYVGSSANITERYLQGRKLEKPFQEI